MSDDASSSDGDGERESYASDRTSRHYRYTDDSVDVRDDLVLRVTGTSRASR